MNTLTKSTPPALGGRGRQRDSAVPASADLTRENLKGLCDRGEPPLQNKPDPADLPSDAFFCSEGGMQGLSTDRAPGSTSLEDRVAIEAHRTATSKPLRTLRPKFLETSVLVIEDEFLIALFVANLLEEMGFASVTTAANEEQALQAADARDFGLLVSDIVLQNSRLNGIDIVTRLVRRNPAPVVFITAHAGPADIERIAAETPRAAVLRKPVDVRGLHNSIASLAETWQST